MYGFQYNYIHVAYINHCDEIAKQRRITFTLVGKVNCWIGGGLMRGLVKGKKGRKESASLKESNRTRGSIRAVGRIGLLGKGRERRRVVFIAS